MSNMEMKKKKGLSFIGGDKLVLLAAIVVVFILFTVINKNFLTWTNFVNILLAASLTGTIAVGPYISDYRGPERFVPGLSGGSLRRYRGPCC